MMMKSRNLSRNLVALVLMLLAGLAGAQTGPAQGDDVLLRALNDEMARAMTELRLGEQAAPYFIAYEVTQKRSLAMEARGDALTQVDQKAERRLRVDLRVGTPQSDSSRVVRLQPYSRTSGIELDGSTNLPLDDNYDALRQRIWIATDVAYKRALEDLAAREAVASARQPGEEPPDQVAVAPLVAREDRGEARLDPEEAAQRLRAVAALLATQPQLEQSMVWLDAEETQVWFLTSEGTATWRREPLATLGLAAATRAEDGEPLLDYRRHRARQLAGLPGPASLRAEALELAERLTALRTLPPLGEFNGPVWFRGEAAAQLLAERFVSQLAPLPRHHASQLPMQGFIDQLAEQGAGLSRRLDARVLPAGVELVDDPLLLDWQGRPLLSASGFDSEGVATQRKVLVQDGRLKTLLSSRAPAILSAVTPGNLRGSFPDASTLVLHSRDGEDEAGLQARMAGLLTDDGREFGLEVERFADPLVENRLGQTSFAIFLTGSEPALPRPVRLNKVYPDGRREATRGVLLADIGNREFRSLVAVGAEPALVVREAQPFSRQGVFSGGHSNNLPASYLVPDLMFEELSASADTRQVRRLPILPKPSNAVAR